MAFGFCYDPARRCSGKAQPGTRILRDTMDELVPELGDLGIYNCRNSRTGSTLSLHGEGRAWDCAIPLDNPKLGNTAAQFFVAAAEMLGVQRVIWGFGIGNAPKEWDSRQGERFWEPYSGPSHDDHCHVELCWRAALELTEKQVKDAYDRYWPKEDWLMALTDDEQKRLLNQSDKTYKALFDKVAGKEVNVLDQVKKDVEAIKKKLGITD